MNDMKLGQDGKPVNVDIFANINFCEFSKTDNFSWIYIFVFLTVLPLKGIIKVIFMFYILSRTFRKIE